MSTTEKYHWPSCQMRRISFDPNTTRLPPLSFVAESPAITSSFELYANRVRLAANPLVATFANLGDFVGVNKMALCYLPLIWYGICRNTMRSRFHLSCSPSDAKSLHHPLPRAKRTTDCVRAIPWLSLWSALGRVWSGTFHCIANRVLRIPGHVGIAVQVIA